jgi:FO synthase
MLRGGADDLGGTLMEETISRMAGSVHGSMRTPAELERIPLDIGRPVRQRTTTYGEVSAERRATVLAAFANWSRTTTTEALDEPPTTRV